MLENGRSIHTTTENPNRWRAGHSPPCQWEKVATPINPPLAASLHRECGELGYAPVCACPGHKRGGQQ